MVVGNGGPFQRALPALLVNPAVHAVRPVGALGVDSLSDGEVGGVDLKNGEVGELIAVWVEELVVVDVVMLAENPASIGTQISLCRLPFDLVVQRLLALVGMGQVKLIDKKQARRQHRCCE